MMISEEEWIRIRASSETAEKIRDSLLEENDEAFEDMRHPTNSSKTPMEIYNALQTVLSRDETIRGMNPLNPRHLRAGSIELREIIVEGTTIDEAVEKFREALKEKYMRKVRRHKPVRITTKILYEIDRGYYKSLIDKIKKGKVSDVPPGSSDSKIATG